MNKVEIGSIISVKFDDGGQETFKLVPSYEADVFENKVSVDSPFGKAVIGRKAGQSIRYQVRPDKLVECKIIKLAMF